MNTNLELLRQLSSQYWDLHCQTIKIGFHSTNECHLKLESLPKGKATTMRVWRAGQEEIEQLKTLEVLAK